MNPILMVGNSKSKKQNFYSFIYTHFNQKIKFRRKKIISNFYIYVLIYQLIYILWVWMILNWD